MAYWVTGSQLPFDDQQVRFIPTGLSTSNPAMDTSAFDTLRQGVEIRRVSELYNSTQPKLWGGSITASGTITHEQNFNTYGQAVSFTEFFADHKFEEKPKFNPVAFVTLGNIHPLPIILNYGPQEQQEAIIEPLTFPQRLNNNEGFDVAHASKGELEDGNHLDGRNAGNSRVEQFIELAQPIQPRPWLDQGEEWIGDTFIGSIHIPGFTTQAQRKVEPYTDQINEYILRQVASFNNPLDSAMISALSALKFGLGVDDDIRPIGKKSTAAGYSVYGPNAARAGTDSIAYIGWKRGS